MQAYHLLNKKVGHILSQDEKKMGEIKKKKLSLHWKVGDGSHSKCGVRLAAPSLITAM